MPITRRRLRPALAALLLLLGSAGAAAIWALLAVAVERHCAWMAVLCALDAILLLRMTAVWSGPGRALLAAAATVLSIALANWWIAGAEVGQMLGLMPWDSIPRLGWAHGWTLLELANDGVSLAWYGIGLLLAAFGANAPVPRWFSGRRRAPSAR